MTLENKARLKQLGWGKKKQDPGGYSGLVARAEKRATELDVRVLKLEKELIDVMGWLDRLGMRYRDRGYDASSIDKAVARIKRALK